MMKQNKKAVAPILIILAIVGLLIVTGYITLQSFSIGSLIGTGSYIERPIFKYIKCEPISGLKYSMDYDLGTNGEWIYKPSVSSSWNAILKAQDSFCFFCGGYRFRYSVCNSQVNSQSNCRIYNTIQQMQAGGKIEVDNIKDNEEVYAIYENQKLISWNAVSGAKYQIGWVPYGLREYDVLSGSSTPVNPNDCITPSSDDSWKYRLISTDSQKVNSQISVNVNQQTLQPEEVRWYVSGYVSSASPSFKLTFQGQNAWCRDTGTSGEIYKINIANIGGGTYYIASPDYSDFLGAVTCCPGYSRGTEVCQSDFTWKRIVQSECGSFQSCGSPNWVPYSANTLIRYSCVSGKCQSETKNVGCANDYDCKDANKICDLNSYTCVNANVNLAGQTIKTIPDNIADCQATGGTWIKTTEQQKSWYNYLGIGQPRIIINEYCKMPTSIWTTLFWIFIIIVIILVLIKFVPFIRGFLKSIPYIGRFIP